MEEKDQFLTQLQRILNYQFKNPLLLQQAITTKAYNANQQNNFGKHRDSLAVLGDAVLNVVTVEYAIQIRSLTEKGDITAFKNGHVKERILAKAMRLVINETQIYSGLAIFADTGERTQDHVSHSRFLAEAFESIIGAIYLDGGINTASEIALKRLEIT